MLYKINTLHIILALVVLANVVVALPKGGGGGGRGGGSSGGSRSGSRSGSGSSSGGSVSGGSGGGWSSSSPSNPSRGGSGSSWSGTPTRSSGPTGRRSVPIAYFGSPSTHVPHPHRPGVVGWFDYDSDDDNVNMCTFQSIDGQVRGERVTCPAAPLSFPSPTLNSMPSWTPSPTLSMRPPSSSAGAKGIHFGNLVAVVVMSMTGFVLLV